MKRLVVDSRRRLLTHGSPDCREIPCAEDQGIGERLTVVAIEDFIALNVIEMSVGDQQQFIGKLREIIESYNARLAAVETDLSLKIDLI